VFNERLRKIAEVINPEKSTPTVIEFVDIAGLVKNAHKGEGLGNQFLAQIRNCDAIVQVVGTFRKDADPEDEIETVKIEFETKDSELKKRKSSFKKTYNLSFKRQRRYRPACQ